MVHIHAYTLTDLHIVPYLYPLRALPDQRQHPDTLMMMRKLGAALGRDWGGAGARHGRTRSQSPLFSAPCTQRRGHRVWCQMLLSRRPNVMAGMQTGGALAVPQPRRWEPRATPIG